MSPAILRGIMASCLALGVADLVWLDVNAERMASAASPEPKIAMESVAAAPSIERQAPVAPPSPISGEVPAPVTATKSPLPSQPEPCVVHFDLGVSIVSDDQAKMLIPIADALKNDPKALVRVEGHADRTGWSGNQGNNHVLSDARAAAIVRALGKLGVPRDRVRTAAFGDTRPVDPRSSEEAFRRNRRAEIRIERTGDR
jgi:peptidoglycan-associated lipoprotein